MKTHIQRSARVPKSFCFKNQIKRGLFFRSSFQSSLLKHADEFFLRNADFVKFRNASKLSREKVLVIRALYREQVMRHG